MRLNAIAGRPPDLIHPPPGCRFAPRCPYVQDKCRDSEPPLRTAGSPEHLFACWYPLVNGMSTSPVASPTVRGPVAAALAEVASAADPAGFGGPRPPASPSPAAATDGGEPATGGEGPP